METKKKTKVEIFLTMYAQTPLSVGAGGSVGSLADKSIVRDGWGRVIIPGSQVKGKARHTAEALARAAHLQVYHLFEQDTEPAERIPRDAVRLLFGYPRQRSPFHFANLVGCTDPDMDPESLTSPGQSLSEQEQQARTQIRPSVAINRQFGTADDARLLFQETSIEEMWFVGKPAIIGTLSEDLAPLDEHLGLVALLWAALRLTTRWGGATSRGLGWTTIEQVEVCCNGRTIPKEELEQALTTLASTNHYRANQHEKGGN
jgi:CRISPR/Cas system CSM-associated protein Csm3 (group 7 of RAMP superfamily)